MEKLLRCKACGYIINEKEISALCPACGLPKTVFEPYKENISEKRKFILELHLHPIAVHLPQASVMIIIPFMILGMFFPMEWSRVLLLCAGILTFLLPVFTLVAAAAGLLDAKTRFKTLTSYAVKKKIIAGGIFFALSCAASVSVFSYNLEEGAVWPVLIFMLLAAGCQYVLGREGIRLMYSRLGGD